MKLTIILFWCETLRGACWTSERMPSSREAHAVCLEPCPIQGWTTRLETGGSDEAVLQRVIVNAFPDDDWGFPGRTLEAHVAGCDCVPGERTIVNDRYQAWRSDVEAGRQTFMVSGIDAESCADALVQLLRPLGGEAAS